jgi:hypothetical protein
MLLCIPVSDPPADLFKKIEPALFGQMAEIADEIGDSVVIARSTETLKRRYGGGRPGNVISPFKHAFLSFPQYRPEQTIFEVV